MKKLPKPKEGLMPCIYGNMVSRREKLKRMYKLARKYPDAREGTITSNLGLPKRATVPPALAGRIGIIARDMIDKYHHSRQTMRRSHENKKE